MKFCPYCNEPIEDSDKYCDNCKRPLVSFASHTDPPIEKTLQPYSYFETQKNDVDYTKVIQDIDLEYDIKKINKEIEQKQNRGESTGELLLNKASLYYKKRDLNTASKILELALNTFKNDNDLVKMAICHNELGLIQEDLGYFDNAIYEFDNAIDILKKLNDNHRLIKVYNNIANVYFTVEDLENSYEYYQAAMNLARDENLILEEVKSSSNLINVLFLLKNFELINKLLDRNAFIFNQMGNIHGTINTLIQYGKLNYNLGEKYYNKSIEFLNEALNLINKISSQLNSFNKARMQWDGQFLLGQVYLKMNNFMNSESFLQKSLESLRNFEMGDSINQGLVLEKLGCLFALKNENQRAIEYFEESIKIYHKFGKDLKVGSIKEQISQIIVDSNGDEFEAIRYLEDALGLFEKINYEKKVADISQKLGDMYINNEMIELAIENFEKARQIYTVLEDEYNISLITGKINSLKS